MITTIPHYITDIQGKRVSVILPVKEYERILEELENREDVQLYDEAKSSKQEYLSAEEVFRSIENERINNAIQSIH